MKSIIIKSSTIKTKFNQFLNSVIHSEKQIKMKGGDDSVIEEEVIMQ